MSIVADGWLEICDGDHGLDVMNQWEVVRMKIRPPAAGTDSPDLQLNLDGEVVYAEVTRILQKEQDKLVRRASD